MTIIQDIREHCIELYNEIEELFDYTGYSSAGHISAVISEDTVEEKTLYRALNRYLIGLDMVSTYIRQTCAEEYEQGMIAKQKDVYYFNGGELQPGDVIQYYDNKDGYWKIGILDDDFSNGVRLVIREEPEIELDGMEIRRTKI